MPPHSIGSGTISFGLVSIPIKLYTAASPAGVSFHLLHAKCGHRIRQQLVCPVDDAVERSDLVKGYEVAKDQYVRVTDEELKALEGEASKVIDITEFVPLPKVDPIYFEKTYHLGPDKGGEKAYRLLAEAMATTDRVALATFVMRGKESLVLIRPAQHGLLLHTMYFADEVRDFGEIDQGETATIKAGELELAVRLLNELSHAEFKPICGTRANASISRECQRGLSRSTIYCTRSRSPSPRSARTRTTSTSSSCVSGLTARMPCAGEAWRRSGESGKRASRHWARERTPRRDRRYRGPALRYRHIRPFVGSYLAQGRQGSQVYASRLHRVT